MAGEVSYTRQAAALPIRGTQVCLITSSNGKRWIIPKGLVDPGHTPAEAALVEAWEEAGLVGVLRRDPVGTYFYSKFGGTYHVTVFLMDVTEVAQEWPERGQRERNWLGVDEAVERIEERALRELVRRVLGGEQPRNGG